MFFNCLWFLNKGLFFFCLFFLVMSIYVSLMFSFPRTVSRQDEPRRLSLLSPTCRPAVTNPTLRLIFLKPIYPNFSPFVSLFVFRRSFFAKTRKRKSEEQWAFTFPFAAWGPAGVQLSGGGGEGGGNEHLEGGARAAAGPCD